MPKLHRIDSNIYQYISPPEATDFTILEVRDWVLKCSDMYGSKSAARLFVARQLEALVKVGLISVNSSGRKKTFSKTAYFNEDKIKIVTKKQRTKKEVLPVHSHDKSIFNELRNERADIEAELAITLAEVDEYKALMARSNALNTLLKASYSEATQKAATLMAKLNVWTHTISLMQLDRKSPC
ncbi:hypothetical protein D0812_24615 [Vibrio owensii]|uniref:Transcriptional regulator VspR n=1 Tax=Vibrio owensii TaxID=696485 RepID=A0ABM6ZPE2_9VIBR|nr:MULTISPECIES: hypothetical protein [Vibrio]AYO17542.1 hypothetical protein D0812_24615 [Vibrio owensii]MDF4613655.1 hypothetical protein [Vibrio parahaemolyticus]HAV1372544.1 hypothetical protein [Vibrio parahaemolyticus]